MKCEHCGKDVRILVFHENGTASCHACAPSVRKTTPVQKQHETYRKTAKGYVVAR